MRALGLQRQRDKAVVQCLVYCTFSRVFGASGCRPDDWIQLVVVRSPVRSVRR
jgi:hypothetical protein